MPNNLALRMRPKTIDQVIGQKHLVGEGKIIRRMVEANRLSSMILYGPPGTGKTAHLLTFLFYHLYLRGRIKLMKRFV